MFHLTPIQTLLMIRRNGKATSRLYFSVNQFCLGRASWKPIVLKFRSPLRYSTSYFPEFLKTLSKKRFVSYNVTSEGNYFELKISFNQRCDWFFQTRISLDTRAKRYVLIYLKNTKPLITSTFHCKLCQLSKPNCSL